MKLLEYIAQNDLNAYAKLWLMRHSEDTLSHEDAAYGPTKTSYSSPYYDYEKAHEYYEQHKQLKGRSRSKSQLSDEGKEIWEVTEANIKKAKEAEQEATSNTFKGQVQQIQDAITALKAQAEGVRGAQKEAVQAKIQSLRDTLSKRKESLRNELKSRQEDTKNKNTRASETTKANNERLSKEAKAKKDQNVNKVSSAIEKMQNDIKKLGNSEQDQRRKEDIRQQMAKLRAGKSLENAKISETLAGAKQHNTAGLAKYKQKNAEDMTAYRAQNASEVKNASDSINGEIKNLRTGLSEFNTQNRAELKSNIEGHRNQIKALREANSANRKALQEKYKNISDQEFDKIAENYKKKGKKRARHSAEGYGDELYHYGTPRHSGRYPYGSGKRLHHYVDKFGGEEYNDIKQGAVDRGFSRKDRNTSARTDATSCNPSGSTTNCFYTAKAYMLRRLGIDAVASDVQTTDREEIIDTLNKNHKGIFVDVKVQNKDELSKAINTYVTNEDSLGFVFFNNGIFSSTGHVCVYEKHGDDVKIFDTQDVNDTNCKYSFMALKYGFYDNTVTFTEFNPEEIDEDLFYNKLESGV